MMGDTKCLILLFGVPAMRHPRIYISHHPLIRATIIHTFFSLIHPEDEFSFKEMRMWGQPKTSSCCLCVWCKSKELGGRGSTRFPTSMVEGISADFLPAIESYWTESRLEFCQTSTREQLYKNTWNVFR